MSFARSPDETKASRPKVPEIGKALSNRYILAEVRVRETLRNSQETVFIIILIPLNSTIGTGKHKHSKVKPRAVIRSEAA